MVMTWAGRGGRGSGSSRLKGAFEAAVREARANPRVLIGLGAILLLLWGYGLIGLFDSVDAAGRRLAGPRPRSGAPRCSPARPGGTRARWRPKG